jgi:hypothetical protein
MVDKGPKHILGFVFENLYRLVAPFRRSRSGSISAIIKWPHVGDHKVARSRRSWIGSIAPIINRKPFNGGLERKHRGNYGDISILLHRG